MSNEPNWMPEPNDDEDKLREIVLLMGGWWDELGRWINEGMTYDLGVCHNDILASARAFGWEYVDIIVWQSATQEWNVSVSSGKMLAECDTELDAHLEMTKRAAAERDKRKKPSRKADAVKILNALTIQPEDVLAALDRLATGDYE